MLGVFFTVSLLFSSFLVVAFGRPSDSIVPQNVVTAPPNCPPGQEWVNGACRDIWIKAHIENLENLNSIESQNTITVPINCKPDQQWVNGACRDVWRSNYNILKNVITAPPNCPSGQEFINGACRDVWIRVFSEASENIDSVHVVELLESNKNVISVPTQCPAGYKPDALGVCREIFA